MCDEYDHCGDNSDESQSVLEAACTTSREFPWWAVVVGAVVFLLLVGGFITYRLYKGKQQNNCQSTKVRDSTEAIETRQYSTSDKESIDNTSQISAYEQHRPVSCIV
ncbi:uncharacterized protein LOC144344485 [Saccoglossus kowalevskii]